MRCSSHLEFFKWHRVYFIFYTINFFIPLVDPDRHSLQTNINLLTGHPHGIRINVYYPLFEHSLGVEFRKTLKHMFVYFKGEGHAKFQASTFSGRRDTVIL